MIASRRLLVALLCPLFLAGALLAVQGCGGGGETEQAQTAEETEPAEESKPDESMLAVEEREEKLALAGYTCPMHPEACSLEPGKCSACGMDLEKTQVQYVCTMCPDVHMHAPGKCAHCGMDLVLRPVSEEKEAGTAQ